MSFTAVSLPCIGGKNKHYDEAQNLVEECTDQHFAHVCGPTAKQQWGMETRTQEYQSVSPITYDRRATAEQLKEEDLMREQMETQSLQVRFGRLNGGNVPILPWGLQEPHFIKFI